MKIKNHKKITNLSFKFKIYIYILFFNKNNYMSKIFPKIYLKFDLKCFHFIVFRFYYCAIIKKINSNKNYITTFVFIVIPIPIPV